MPTPGSRDPFATDPTILRERCSTPIPREAARTAAFRFFADAGLSGDDFEINGLVLTGRHTVQLRRDPREAEDPAARVLASMKRDDGSCAVHEVYAPGGSSITVTLYRDRPPGHSRQAGGVTHLAADVVRK